MGYVFDWDARKAAANLQKHGVTFQEGSSVFGDARALRIPDLDHSHDELRYLLLGHSDRDRLLVVSSVERGPRTRLISARRATRNERTTYEEEAQ